MTHDPQGQTSPPDAAAAHTAAVAGSPGQAAQAGPDRDHDQAAGEGAPAGNDVSSGQGDQGSPGPGWVPYKAAAEQAGVAAKTVRNWYAAGKVPKAYVPGPNGREVWVPLDAVTALAATKARPAAAAPDQAQAADSTHGGALIPLKEVSNLIAHVDRLQHEVGDLDRERRKAEFRAEQLEFALAAEAERAAALAAQLEAITAAADAAGHAAPAAAAPAPDAPRRRWWAKR